MINLNELNNWDLPEFVAGQRLKYLEQKELHANHSMQVYGGISGAELMAMSKALDRAIYSNPRALEEKQKVDAIIQSDFSNNMIHKPVGKIKPLHEVYAEQNKMSMNKNKFHDVRPLR